MKELRIIEKGTLTGIADAVRSVKNGTEDIPVKKLEEEILTLSSPEESNEVLVSLIDRSLTEIVIPKSITRIGAGAFYNCRFCKSYDFTAFETYEEIPTLDHYNAFNGINPQAKIYVRGQLYNAWKRLSNWSQYADYFSAVGDVPPDSASAGLGIEWNVDSTALVVTERLSCKDAVITIPEFFVYGGSPYKFESIGDNAFENDGVVTEVILPEYGVEIGVDAFSNCANLKKIVNVKKAGYNSFYYCTALESVTFAKEVKDFSLGAFYNCTACALYDFSACTNIPSLPSTTAISVDYFTKIVVPDALYDSWITATNWSNYAGKIVKASEA